MASKEGNRNALRHGLYARESVLPWENPEAFAALHQSLIQELQPEGVLEHEAVREVAELHWRKQRLSMGYLLPYYRDMPPAELIDAAKQGLVPLAGYLARSAQQPSGTITATASQILDYVKGRLSTSEAAKQPTALPVMQTPAVMPRNIVEQAYDPATIAMRLKIESQIDNRIAKTMARLVCLKEYKLIYVDEAPPVTAARSPMPPPAAEPVVATEPAKQLKWLTATSANKAR